MDSKWSPICGHYFWDNQNGATAFCKTLGYPSGSLERTNNKYDEDSIQVGHCNLGEELMACTGAGSKYRSDTDLCQRGNSVGIRITCSNQALRYSSCGVESK